MAELTVSDAVIADPRNQAVAPGVVTTEYERAVSGGWWGSVLMVVGVLVASSSTIVELITGLDAKAGQIAGVVFSVLGALYRASVDRAYIQGRTVVKAATATGAAQVAIAEAGGGVVTTPEIAKHGTE